MTVGCLEVPRMEAVGFGVMHIDETNRIIDVSRKSRRIRPPMPGKPDVALASMGIYVFDTKLLFDQLRRDAVEPGSASMISARTSSPTSSRTGRRSPTTSPIPACGPTTSR